MSQSPAKPSPFFPRTHLAKVVADQALDETLGISGGLFLAAPRRTGKSTFVRQDLLPELSERGLLVIYVDLWADRAMDPAVHLANAIRQTIVEEEGPAAAGLRKLSKLGKLSLSAFGTGISFDLSPLGLSPNATLADALRTLSQASEKRIVLVVDEAQHALTTVDGANALFSLKAARDSLNADAGMHGLQLIATGSNRDKLAGLVNNRDQAFYGAELSTFPALGLDYIRWLLPKIRLDLDEGQTLEVFRRLGSRPESFLSAVRKAEIVLASESGALLDHNQLLLNAAEVVATGAKNDFFSSITGLSPLQAALFKELAKEAVIEGPRTGPFTGTMKARLLARLDRDIGAGHGISVETSSVQNALDALRETGFLWRSHRGGYYIEDEQAIEWLNEQPQGQGEESDPAQEGPERMSAG